MTDPMQEPQKGFMGLNNQQDPASLGYRWLTAADNVLCDDSGTLVTRPGFALYASNIVDAYATRFGRVITTSNSYLPGGPFQWTELGTWVYAQSKTHQWCIRGDEIEPWGIPTAPTCKATIIPGNLTPGRYQIAGIYADINGKAGGVLKAAEVNLTDRPGCGITLQIPPLSPYWIRFYVSQPDGATLYFLGSISADSGSLGSINYTLVYNRHATPLRTMGLTSPPLGECLGAFRGRLAVGVYYPSTQSSMVYFSQQYSSHLFDLSKDAVQVAGKVTLLAGFHEAMVIGTERQLFIMNPDYQVTTILNVGAIANTLAMDSTGIGYFWTTKGLVKALPITFITAPHWSSALREKTTASLAKSGGSSYYILSTIGTEIPPQDSTYPVVTPIEIQGSST